MRKVYILYPEGDYAARLKTRNPLKARWYFFRLGWVEFWRAVARGEEHSPRRIVVTHKFTNTYPAAYPEAL